MENLNTNSIENYSQIESRIIQAIPLMTPENQRILADFAMAMVGTQPTVSQYTNLTAQERIQELLSITSRMKSHSIILGQFFTRSSTKKAAIAGMEAEISNMQTLWALVRADLSEVQP